MTVGPAEILLWLGLATACVTDLREQKIPNLLTFPLMLAGVLLHLAGGEPLVGLVGIGAAFALHFLLFALGIDRAGDAKLMMAVGAFVGWREMLEATFWSFVLLVPAGVLMLLLLGRLGNFWKALVWTGKKALQIPVGDAPEPTMLPKAPIIAGAVLLAQLTALPVWES